VLAIAIVGSRRATPHGIDVARRLASGLAAAGFTVVSGLARGIDAASHRGALESGGRTLAFLGSGLDRIYPAEHLKLAEEIAGRGAVLSEFSFGTPPYRSHFPARNRAIAWIAWATIVVEAARDSGSLITAKLAADEGRSVYAVPGPVGERNAEGTNGLLRAGALICRGAGDVIEDLAPQVGATGSPARPAAPPRRRLRNDASSSCCRGPAGSESRRSVRLPGSRRDLSRRCSWSSSSRVSRGSSPDGDSPRPVD